MEQEKSSKPTHINRIFEQPEGAISCYSDFAQVVGTGNEVVLQFYETIPGTPGPGGQIQMIRTRLRATISVSVAHAKNIGNLLIKQAGIPEKPQPQVPQTGETK
jgi:hypothetical protein